MEKQTNTQANPASSRLGNAGSSCSFIQKNLYNIHECFNNPFQTLCNIYDQSQKKYRCMNYVDTKCNGNW